MLEADKVLKNSFLSERHYLIAGDILDEFIAHYNEGIDAKNIEKIVMEECKDYFSDYDDMLPSYLGLMAAMYEVCVDTSKIGQTIKRILAERKECQELNEDAQNRFESAIEFFQKKKNEPLSRNQSNKQMAIFDCGDCLSLSFPDGSYGAALVVGREDNEGLNLIVPLKYKEDKKPSKEVFMKREFIELQLFQIFPEKVEAFSWYRADLFSDVKEKVELVCDIEVTIDDFRKCDIFALSWDRLWEKIERYFDELESTE